MDALPTASKCATLVAEKAKIVGIDVAKRVSGTTVRLVPPIYVKPFVPRQKNDAADADAIVDAASRPTMRFVALKREEQQARSMIFRGSAATVHWVGPGPDPGWSVAALAHTRRNSPQDQLCFAPTSIC